jgi:hypothetical protein
MIGTEEEELVVFKVGERPPKVWLHMEFDIYDTNKYLGGGVIADYNEAMRLAEKYL